MHISNKSVKVFFPIHHRLVAALLLFFIGFTDRSSAQARIECDDSALIGFTVRSVIIKSGWVSKSLQQEVDEAAGVGKPYDPLNAAKAVTLVKKALVFEEEKYLIGLTGATSALYMDNTVCDKSDQDHPKQVDIVIRAFYIRIDLYNVGNNILPVPRRIKPAFFSNVPGLLLATSPRFGFNNDRNYGYSVAVQTSTDLLHLPGSKNGRKLNLFMDLEAKKSINELFRTLGGGLQLDHPVYKERTTGWNIGAYYADQLAPLGIGDFKTERIRFFTNIDGTFKNVLLRKYNMGGSYSFLKTQYVTSPNVKAENAENNFQFHATGDGKIKKGFDRIAFWFDGGSVKDKTNNTKASYQRFLSQLGYATPLGNTHNSVEFEAGAGMGFSWGQVPVYNQFYAGNTSSNFLYAPLKSSQLQAIPPGPMIRSLGEREGGFPKNGGTEGGNSFWNVSVSFSIPVSKWAKPLIPDIVAVDAETDENGAVIVPEKTLRSLVKGQVKSVKTQIETDLQDRDGLSEDAAAEQAERIVDKDIRPPIFYLADRANIYSFKPIVLFDLAQLNKRGTGNKTWGAAGAGIQLNVVNARLDLAYMQTLFPSSDKSKGNFLLRFVVQDFY